MHRVAVETPGAYPFLIISYILRSASIGLKRAAFLAG